MEKRALFRPSKALRISLSRKGWKFKIFELTEEEEFDGPPVRLTI